MVCRTDTFLKILIAYTVNNGLLTWYVQYPGHVWAFHLPIDQRHCNQHTDHGKHGSTLHGRWILIFLQYALLPHTYIFMGIFFVLNKGVHLSSRSDDS